MFLKAFGILTPVVLGGVYVAGGFDSVYSREVGKPQAAVMSALADLDITQQPGAPGSDPEASGGVRPMFKLERGPDSMTWLVMAGDKVATRMTASFEPIDGGAGTRVRTSVERGDAPDDVVSPAFRSEGITLGLFSLAVEDELNELTRTRMASDQECAALLEKLMGGGSGENQYARGTEQSGDAIKAIMKLHAVEMELRRNGCDMSSAAVARRNKAMEQHVSAMSDAAKSDVSFEPGKPMVDLSKK